MEQEVRNSNAAVVLADGEKTLDQEVSLIEQRALSLEISSEDEYKDAGSLVTSVKEMQKKVKDYWEPIRLSTKKAYDDVLAHKKEMLSPLESAEKIIKLKITLYVIKRQEEERRRQEELRRMAKEEADRKLAEAIAASDRGDETAAEFAMAEAEIMDDEASKEASAPTRPKADGISLSRAWKITGIDESKVPISVNGCVVRPVDASAVSKLIKESKGTIQIPGITYEETVCVSARS